MKENTSMTDQIREHKEWIKEREDKVWDEKDKEYHLTNIKWLQHERLIHLIVTVIMAGIWFVSLISGAMLNIAFASPMLFVAFFVLTITEILYIVHYCRLENTVQSWYAIYRKIHINKER